MRPSHVVSAERGGIHTPLLVNRKPHDQAAKASPPRRGVISCSMGISWRQKLGQSFNANGIALFGHIVMRDPQLAIPHISVPNIASINWQAIRQAGFEGCVFDKDNTLTEPYSLQVSAMLQPSLRECLAAFQGRLVLMSNSAGLEQFDPEGVEASALESALQVPVLRHRDKKPGGAAADLERHFGCEASKLVMIGDRLLTDIVYGNRHGMLTIQTAPLTKVGEPAVVRLARRLEAAMSARWAHLNLQAVAHPLAMTDTLCQSFTRK